MAENRSYRPCAAGMLNRRLERGRRFVMEIRALRYFLTVAREGNITKAAESLHVSQPTLSRQIMELEEELGKKLFLRHSHSVRLTEEGLLLRERAGDILGMVDKTEEEFKSLDDVSGGDVYIGCAESEGMACLIQAAAHVRELHPRIRFHFYTSGTDAISERLDKGLLDLAVIVQPVNLTRYQYLTIPHTDRWGLLMKKSDPLAEKESIRLEDIQGLPLICSRQGLDSDLLEWFGEFRDSLNIVATYDMLYNTSLMVREGFGYALGFENLIYTGTESALCFRPLSPVVPSPLYIIWKKYQVFTPAANLLIQEAKSLFKK